MGKSAPKAPDPAKVSAAQTQSNQQTAAYNAALNRINQSSPFGSISYSNAGTDPATGAPIYSQTTSLSPQLQGLLDSQLGAQQGISGAISGAIGNLPTQAFSPQGIDTSSIADASYQSQLHRLQPQFEDASRNLIGSLSDRGIPIGSEVWTNEQNRFDQARNDSLAQAARQAELDASNEYQRQFGNQLTQYQVPFQTLSSLMGNSSPVQNPSFSPFATSSSAGTDVAGNIWNKYQADLNNYNNQQSNLFGGLLGLGSLAMNPASAFGYKLWG